MGHARSAIDDLWVRLGLEPDTAFHRSAVRHSETLETVNIAPLRILCGERCAEEFYRDFHSLFACSFFIDHCLDQVGDENVPQSMFASLMLYADYVQATQRTTGVSPEEARHGFDSYMAAQLRYQRIERRWHSPVRYHADFSGYDRYFRKQVLLLHPLESLPALGFSQAEYRNIYEFISSYYSVILCVDDIMDVERDIETCTLTPLLARHLVQHDGALPTVSEIARLREWAHGELDGLMSVLRRQATACSLQVQGYERALALVGTKWAAENPDSSGPGLLAL